MACQLAKKRLAPLVQRSEGQGLTQSQTKQRLANPAHARINIEVALPHFLRFGEAVDDVGAAKVDPYSRTSVPNIYAVSAMLSPIS